ncbi:glycosyltransferase involved in cell wall biosynthesis [Halanaerobium sp. DL-01]|uniref:glycosyltransferase n=1 Tax=Halanaerobium sp. DL-01 TaxID=1653064 RepID=UPI000DF444B0|nr:glycosyltransferase [Halanaerobium sp. DL-01]RCW83293.1 glycosyltransferase involved in cell wall biosynthesis [Halanaerobium sp. DL-01]
MKRIVFLNSCPVWGGGEKWTFTTARLLNQDPAYDIYIAAGSETELFKRAKNAGIKTEAVEIRSGISVLNPFKSKRFIDFLKKKNIDIMFLNMSQDLKFGGITGKIAGLDRIIYRRGSAIPIKNRFYNKYLLKDCVTDIIANSRATKDTILKNTSQWLSEDKITIIYNGINLSKIDKAGEEAINLHEEFKISQDKVIIANIGRLNYQKGHEFLLKAAAIIKEKRNDFVILIIGSGEREQELKKLAREYNVSNNIIFTGFRDDIYKILPGIDFLLHTARWEGFGFVIAEAMAASKPVVSTDVSNISELITDGENGFLAEAENSEDIARQTIKMIDLERDARLKMGKKGREYVENNFVLDKMNEGLKELINNFE